jgi:hypothetical protein
VSAQDGTEQWRKEIPIKTLITGTSAANPVFIDDRMFIVLTPRLPAINLGSACTDWDFTSPNLSNAGFRAGIAYHAGFKTLFVRDNGHLLAIKYQD